MKKLLFILLLLPLASFSQSQAEYEAMMKKYVDYYNTGNNNEIESLFNEESRAVFEKYPFTIETEDKIRSFKYIGNDGMDPFVIRVFKIESTEDTYAMSFSLDADGKFRTFRQKTSSPEIDEMLRNSK